jgi:uncharacterized protein (DUF4415 family)
MSDKKLIGGNVPTEDEENPEWTKKDFARARSASEIHGHSIARILVRKRGRPPKAEDERKKQVTLRLSQDVLSAARNTGSGWQSRIDDILRTAFTAGRATSMADLGAAIIKSAKGDGARATSRMPRQTSRRSLRDRNEHKKRA